MNTNPLTTTANPTASEKVTEILGRQAILLRCCWNTMAMSSVYDSSVTHHLAMLMCTAGAALENIPDLHRDLGANVVPIKQEEWLSSAVKMECQKALMLFARTTVPNTFAPGLVEVDHNYRDVRRAWIILCNTLAEHGEITAEYGILAAEKSAVPPVNAWFVQKVIRATRVFGFRRTKHARQVADDLWQEAFYRHRKLRPAPATTSFGDSSS